MNVVIFGAQGTALGACKAIKELFPNINILTFLVTEMGMNAPVLGGISVRELHDFSAKISEEDKKKIIVLIGTPENVMKPIEQSLEKAGFHNYVRLDSVRWAHMMEHAFVKSGEYMPLSTFLVGCNKPKIHVYKMVHHKDKKLESEYCDPKYMTTLQVGASHTKERISTVVDDQCDNISEKNGNYSELTGLYWMWKNCVKSDGSADNSYYGLAHYRRRLLLSDDDLLRLVDNNIDVVLPYPMPYEPNIGAHAKRYLNEDEWQAVLTALDEMYPDYARAFTKILKQKYFYNYNIILAKGTVFNEYCSWLFPLLFRIEKLNDPDGKKKPNRYMGYVSETLETLFFMYNSKNFQITHAGCEFLI